MSFCKKATCVVVTASLVLGLSPASALSVASDDVLGSEQFLDSHQDSSAGAETAAAMDAVATAEEADRPENGIEYERLTSVRVKEVTELQEGKQYVFTVTSGSTQYALSEAATAYMNDGYRAGKAISIKDGVMTCKTSFDMNYLVWKYGEDHSLSVLDYYYLNAMFSSLGGGLTADSYSETYWTIEDGQLCGSRFAGTAKYRVYYDYYYEFSSASPSSGISGDQVTVYEVLSDCDHQMVFHDQVDPVCTTGNIAYYSCSECGKMFADEEGAEELTTVKDDHHFGAPVEGEDAYVATCDACGTTKSYSKDARSAYMTLWGVVAKFSDSGYPWVPNTGTQYGPGLQSGTAGMEGTPTSALNLTFYSERDFTLEFDYFGSSENALWAYLTLSLDGSVIRNRAGGESGAGAHYSIHLSAGEHLLYAAYIKSAESVGGLDAGFLYNIKAAVDCEHQWVKGETVAPTCTEDGYTPYTCDGCNGYEKRDVVSALGHDWETTSVVPATCTEDGYTAQVCERCTATQDIDVVSALGHDFTRYVDNGDETHTLVCSRTGCTTVSDAEDATAAHEYVNGFCEKCGHEYVRPTIEAEYAGPWTCSVEWTADEVAYAIISGYDASLAKGDAVVPASVAGVPVREIAEGAFANVSGVVTIPDTVTSIHANAFAGSAVTRVDMMGRPSAIKVVGGDAVALPSGAAVRSFQDNLDGANVSSAWNSVFGAAASELIEDTVWSFHFDYANGKDSVPVVAVDGDQGWGYHGASDSNLYQEIPSSFAGFAVSQLGERVFNVTGTQYDNETKLAVLRVPASVTSMHQDALAKCDATVLFDGALPEILGGADVPTVPYTTYEMYYSDNPATVDTWADCGWYKVQGTYNWGLEMHWMGYKWNVSGYHGAETDLVIPEEYAGRIVDTVEARAIDATNLTSITVDSLIQAFERECVYNCECPIYFKGRPHSGVDYEHEFVGRDGNATTAQLYYELSLESQWQNSQWVKNGKYNFSAHQSNINRLFTYKQVGDGEYLVSGFIFNYLDNESTDIHSRGILQLPSTLQGDEVQVNGVETVVENGVVVGVADDAFYCEDWIVTVYVPQTYRTLGYEAFWGCSSLQEVKYNGGVEASTLQSIGERCFWYCDPMVGFDVPASVTSIADGAFICAGLQRFNVAKDNPSYCDVDGVLFSKDMTELCMYPEGIEARSYTVPEGVTYIRKEALRGSLHACHLAEINLPTTLKKIGWGAFLNNELLIEMTLPESVEEMDASVFQYCTNLRTANIPSKITAIPDCTFDFCEALTTVSLHDNITSVGEAAFEYCTSLQMDALPARLQTVGECAFRHCERLNVDLGGLTELTSVDAEGFSVTAMSSLTLPASLTSIGRDSFAGNTALRNLDFGDSKICVVPYGAFEFCTSLDKVILPSRITSVGERAFYNCISLAGNPVAFCSTGSMSIGENAFDREHPENELVIIPIGIQAYAYPRTEAAELFADYISLEVFADTGDIYLDGTINETMDIVVEASTEKGNLKYLWEYEGRLLPEFTDSLCSIKPTRLGESQAVVEIWHEYNPDERIAVVVTINATDDRVLPLPGTVERGGMTEMLSAADEAMKNITEADDGTGINDNALWSTPACFKVLRDAIKAAQDVNDDPYSTQEEIQAAADALHEEILDFNGALQSGWRVPPIFTDVDYGTTEGFYVKEAWRLGLMEGSGDGTFGVSTQMTRVEAVEALYRMCVADIPEGWGINETPFTDVAECDQYTNAVNWAYAQGVLTASGDASQARPGEAVTRAELATMAWIAAGRPSATSVDVILDADDVADVPKDARRAMAWAIEKGILDADTTGGGLYLRPAAALTRGDAAKSVVLASGVLMA